MNFEEQLDVCKKNLKDYSTLSSLMGVLCRQESDVLKELLKKAKDVEESIKIFNGPPIPNGVIQSLEQYMASAEYNAKQFTETALLLKKIVKDLEVEN